MFGIYSKFSNDITCAHQSSSYFHIIVIIICSHALTVNVLEIRISLIEIKNDKTAVLKMLTLLKLVLGIK